MPTLAPFSAYRYNPEKVSSLQEVLSPPYDIISAERREELYRSSPYNFVRLDFKKGEGDRNIHEAAARDLAHWIDAQVFCREKTPSFYIYRQDYRDLGGKKASRIGLIGLVGLEDVKVFKHERTLEGPKEDRTALLANLRANMSPVFCFFEDPSGRIHKELCACMKNPPLVDVELDKVRHRLFRQDDPSAIRRLSAFFKAKPMYIADGHHRFEVSQTYYARQPKETAPDTQGPNYVMTYLCDAQRNDMTIYPTHRVVRLPGVGEADIKKLLASHFCVKRMKNLKLLTASLEKKKAGKNALGVIYLEKDAKNSGGRPLYLRVEPRKPYRKADVFLAEEYLIMPLLGGEAISRTDKVRYTRNAAQAESWLLGGEAHIAVLLPKMSISEVIQVSKKGVFLPQKSTYFYPKLLSGLVFYKFESAKAK